MDEISFAASYQALIQIGIYFKDIPNILYNKYQHSIP